MLQLDTNLAVFVNAIGVQSYKEAFFVVSGGL